MSNTYTAPIDDIEFALKTSASLKKVQALENYQQASDDLISAVLTEAGKLASEVLAPLNQKADENGCVLEDGVVKTPQGFKEAFNAYRDGGWMGLGFEEEIGGQGMPESLTTAVNEIWHASNMAFSLCPLLTQGAIDAISVHGSGDIKSTYLNKLVSCEWTGTMNLTEPQAGSDLGLVRTQAIEHEDHYRIKGQKIFITYGEHDLSENIIHLVLARLNDAPEGVKGLSLFLVPKYIVDENANPITENDLKCIKIEHKLGIHGSPTCALSFGDNTGAVGYLIGEKNAGLACMFTMMNKARHAVGLEGLAITERSYQQALAYANERVQSNPAGSDEQHAKIIEHPDVKRMLLLMKSNIEAMRGLCYWHASCMDLAKSPDEATSKVNRKLVDFLTPIVKGWCTEMANELTSYGIQIHGGMGYIEETGSAQHYRDARIASIYEGTTAIQANDLIGRKLLKNSGKTVLKLIDSGYEFIDELEKLEDQPAFAVMKSKLRDAMDEMMHVSEWLIANGKSNPALVAGASVNYLMLCGLGLSGLKIIKQAYAAHLLLQENPENQDYLQNKIFTAQFYAAQMLPRGAAYEDIILNGSESILKAQL